MNSKIDEITRFEIGIVILELSPLLVSCFNIQRQTFLISNHGVKSRSDVLRAQETIFRSSYMDLPENEEFGMFTIWVYPTVVQIHLCTIEFILANPPVGYSPETLENVISFHVPLFTLDLTIHDPTPPPPSENRNGMYKEGVASGLYSLNVVFRFTNFSTPNPKSSEHESPEITKLRRVPKSKILTPV